jgi:predicted RNA-binding protein with PIN domain
VTDPGATPLRALPDPVRARVLALAAEALGRLAVEHVPAPLKKVSSFAPAKRARLAGPQIAAVLERDPQFRDRLAVQVRAAVGPVAEAVTTAVSEGRLPGDVDRTEAAATAWLLRVPGWEELSGCAATGEEAGGRDAGAAAPDEAGAARRTSAEAALEKQVRDLTARVAQVRADADSQRARDRERLEKVKGENVDLRRKLGQTRSRLSAVQAEADELRSDAEIRARGTEHAAGAAEAEVRRLRARVESLEQELAAARGVERSAKVTGSVRARLLLDTLSEAAQGLRRELALPAVDRLPADELTGDAGREGVRVSTGRRSMELTDPRLLEELLRLPRAHLVVDGYNVTKTSWPELPLDRQRDRLLAGVASLAARTRVEVTVVFDAADTGEAATRPLVSPPRGVRVRFSPVGIIADDVIRELLDLEPPGRPVVVVTSDRALAADVERRGFRAVAAATLPGLLGRG